MTTSPPTCKANAPTCKANGFNYCKCAKTLIAIPAYPLIALTAASFFTIVAFQVIAGICAVVATYAVAVWLDRITLLSNKINPR